MTQTIARSGLRPVANAFGTSVSAIATLGFGVSDNAHSRSMTPCSCGASCGLTSRAPSARSATLSLATYWKTANPPAISSTSTGEMP